MKGFDEMSWLKKGKSAAQQQRRHQINDTAWRDVYDTSRTKIGKQAHGQAAWLTPASPFMGFFGVYLLIYLLAGIIRMLLVTARLPLSAFGIQISPWSWWQWFKFLALEPPWNGLSLLIAVGGAIGFWVLIYQRGKTNNQEVDASDLLVDEGDSRLEQPEDLPRKYDIVPDAGAHYENIRVTALLSHMSLKPQGLKHVEVVQRYDGKDGQHLKDEPKLNQHGEWVTKSESIIDTNFQQKLFTSSGIPEQKIRGRNLRHLFDARQLLYNPGNKIFGKQKGKTVADVINHTWYFPEYELQRPAGIYIADTEPNNTNVLAMTRAGKGQTIIEPTVDAWTRADEKWNFLCNDPKGELYTKFYYPATRRGFMVLCFNLINDSKTNIFNPLGYAVEAARNGNFGKVSEYVGKIGDIFFPEVKGADPMWNNAANNTFKRSAIGLIDYYYEEERALRARAEHEGWSSQRLNREIDVLWGHVTLYNVYQMMVELAAKKSSNKFQICVDPDELKPLQDAEDKMANWIENRSIQCKGEDNQDHKQQVTKKGIHQASWDVVETDAKRSYSDVEQIIAQLNPDAYHKSYRKLFDDLAEKQKQLEQLNQKGDPQNDQQAQQLEESIQQTQNGLLNEANDLLATYVTEDGQLNREYWEQTHGGDNPDDEVDYLTLFFEATSKLPRNSIRDQVMNAHNAVLAMAKSEKTIASVYGIALTALSFFTDPKISRLTSGRPSQNFDMIGLSFPRRIEVRFDPTYLERTALRDNRYRWTAFHDREMQHPYKDSTYESLIDADGWVNYFFKPIFEEHKVYLQLDILEIDNNQLVKRFYFEFTKGYQRSLSGRSFIKDPVTHERIIKDGTLRELKWTTLYDNENHVRYDQNGHVLRRLDYGETQYPYQKVNISKAPYVENNQDIRDLTHADAMENNTITWTIKKSAFSQVKIYYTEQPRAMFVVTPPHMMSYARLILIMLDQLFNMQVSSSYLTLPSQKPFYGTNYMLDEVGNLQSGGKGIPGLQTKESIGLGQSQQYTLILQTLQQLKDVYGDSIDKILQGNTGNTIYLKSTDDSMLDQLEKMSGVMHYVSKESKTVTRDNQAIMNKVDAKTSVTTSKKERPVINKNDMLLIPKCNDMVFGHGYPIWSTNETALPMAYALHSKLPHDLNKPSYSLVEVPSTSNTNDFDRLANKPNFFAMVNKRVQQARLADEMRERYRRIHGAVEHEDGSPLSNDEMTRVVGGQDQLANDIMDGIRETLSRKHAEEDRAKNQMDEEAEILTEQRELDEMEAEGVEDTNVDEMDDHAALFYDDEGSYVNINENTMVDNQELKVARQKSQQQYDQWTKKVYADGLVSEADLGVNGDPDKGVLDELGQAYGESIPEFINDRNNHFQIDDDNNLSLDGQLLIVNSGARFAEQAEQNHVRLQNVDQNERNNQQEDERLEHQYEVKDAFVQYLRAHPDWSQIANGVFLEKFKQIYHDDASNM